MSSRGNAGRLSLKPVLEAFPKEVGDRLTDEQKKELVEAINRKLRVHFAFQPIGKRKHGKTGEKRGRRHNELRFGLIGGIFDAYMDVRGDDVEHARGFKHVADAVLRAAGLSFRVTDHDMVKLRKQRREFVNYVKAEVRRGKSLVVRGEQESKD